MDVEVQERKMDAREKEVEVEGYYGQQQQKS